VYSSLDWEENVPDPCWSLSHTLTAFVVACMWISLCGLAGNGGVMWFLGFQTKQSPFTVYILNLAVAAFSLLLLFLLYLSAFLTMTIYCKSLYPFIHHYRLYNLVLAYLFHRFDLSSLGLLTALSVERCVSVL
ncbi:MRGRH protein, partial [Regulus satrapa]|nr:MRGRH protein [Regulus satrapa]